MQLSAPQVSRAALLTAAAAALCITVNVSGQSTGQPSTKNGDWPAYTADNRGTRPEYKLEGTPLVVRGVMYGTGGTRRDVFALDAKTGEVMWVHSMREGKRAAIAPRQLSGRGVSYWTDGRGDERVIYVTTGYRL